MALIVYQNSTAWTRPILETPETVYDDFPLVRPRQELLQDRHEIQYTPAAARQVGVKGLTAFFPLSLLIFFIIRKTRDARKLDTKDLWDARVEGQARELNYNTW